MVEGGRPLGLVRLAPHAATYGCASVSQSDSDSLSRRGRCQQKRLQYGVRRGELARRSSDRAACSSLRASREPSFLPGRWPTFDSSSPILSRVELGRLFGGDGETRFLGSSGEMADARCTGAMYTSDMRAREVVGGGRLLVVGRLPRSERAAPI